MDAINELDLRRTLSGASSRPEAQTLAVVNRLLDPGLSWEEKRPHWMWLYSTGREASLFQAVAKALNSKMRVPFDLIVELCAREKVMPTPLAVASLLKGVRKQRALDELLVADGWDRFDARIAETREQLRSKKLEAAREFKMSLLEKFEFLQSQRMSEQAGRTLRRMVDLFPNDEQFLGLKSKFDEVWARDVLANHISTLETKNFGRTLTEHSVFEEEMLAEFAKAGEAEATKARGFAADLAIAFWFMGDYARGLEILNWAEPSAANDWLKAEMLLAARHFIAALEWLGHLETKYVKDPESTFAISYLRAQCLQASGQEDLALEILESISHVRPNYRSTNALIREWTEGANWE